MAAAPATTKRLFDLIVAILAAILLLPIAITVALAIFLTIGRPILFRQLRPGLHERPFELLKFRTMTTTGANGTPGLPDAQRLTRLGRLLRQTSLDELPELVNVLRGEMSLVGPRPLLMVYLERYAPWQRRRHDVLPGITGLAQINGRNGLSWDERFALDVWYIDHWSLGLDIKILMRTVWKVLIREGIDQPGSATVEEFTGSRTAGSNVAERQRP
ncbi:MAG: sugar transferase [Gemmatimonadaceae bacterium]